MPQLTFSKLIIGFEDWFKTNFKEIASSFDATAEYFFDTLEDFAVEIFYDILILKLTREENSAKLSLVK